MTEDQINDTRQYYKTWQEAEEHRKKGERMYYMPYKGYYIVSAPVKRSFWGFK